MPQVIAGYLIATDEEFSQMSSRNQMLDLAHQISASGALEMGLTQDDILAGTYHLPCGCWAEDGCQCDYDPNEDRKTDSYWDNHFLDI